MLHYHEGIASCHSEIAVDYRELPWRTIDSCFLHQQGQPVKIGENRNRMEDSDATECHVTTIIRDGIECHVTTIDRDGIRGAP